MYRWKKGLIQFFYNLIFRFLRSKTEASSSPPSSDENEESTSYYYDVKGTLPNAIGTSSVVTILYSDTKQEEKETTWTPPSSTRLTSSLGWVSGSLWTTTSWTAASWKLWGDKTRGRRQRRKGRERLVLTRRMTKTLRIVRTTFKMGPKEISRKTGKKTAAGNEA